MLLLFLLSFFTVLCRFHNIVIHYNIHLRSTVATNAINVIVVVVAVVVVVVVDVVVVVVDVVVLVVVVVIVVVAFDQLLIIGCINLKYQIKIHSGS